MIYVATFPFAFSPADTFTRYGTTGATVKRAGAVLWSGDLLPISSVVSDFVFPSSNQLCWSPRMSSVNVSQLSTVVSGSQEHAY